MAQTKAQLQAAYDRLVEQHETFRRNVVQTAQRYAEENEWCSVVDEALEEMGLTLPPSTVQVTVEFDARQFARMVDITPNQYDIQDNVRDRLGGGYGGDIEVAVVKYEAA